MNILDILMLVLFGFVGLVCCYQGFLRSTFTLIGFFAACLLAIVFSPMVSNIMENNPSLHSAMVSYTEGSEMLADEDVELARMPISQLSAEQIHTLTERGKFPSPINSLIEKNLHSAAFEKQGISQLADYISYTFASFVFNVLAFLIVFLIAFVVAIISIAVIDNASPFLVMRKFDLLAAGGIGLILSSGLCLLIALFIPVILFMMGQQLAFVRELVDESLFARLFYQHNVFFYLIDSV